MEVWRRCLFELTIFPFIGLKKLPLSLHYLRSCFFLKKIKGKVLLVLIPSSVGAVTAELVRAHRSFVIFADGSGDLEAFVQKCNDDKKIQFVIITTTAIDAWSSQIFLKKSETISSPKNANFKTLPSILKLDVLCSVIVDLTPNVKVCPSTHFL